MRSDWGINKWVKQLLFHLTLNMKDGMSTLNQTLLLRANFL